MNWNRFWRGSLRDEAGDAGTDAGGSGGPIDTGSTPTEASPASHFADVVDSYLGVEAAEAPKVATPSPAAAPVATSVAPPVPATNGTVAASVPTPTPTAPAPLQAATVPPVTPQSPASSPTTLRPPSQPSAPDPQRWQTARQAATADFERALSNFSEQDIVSLMTEPHKVLPRFGAELAMNVFDMTLRSVMTMLPQVISAHQSHNEQERAAHEQFYGMYPQLRSHPQGIETLYRVGPAYNQANAGRTIDPPTRMREIGEIVCRSLGIDPTPQNVQAAAAAVAPTAPTPSQPSPVPILPPHTPAGVGGAAAPPNTSRTDWDDILYLRRA